MINCMIAGVGGQGTVLASKLIAAAAMKRGIRVRTTETIGMAQRGGSVVSHIRMGQIIHSPLIPLKKAHLIIAFEPAEAVRLIPFLSENGTLIACDNAVKPVASSLSAEAYDPSVMLRFLEENVKELILISGKKLLTECCSAKGLNVALLGAATQCGILPFDTEDLKCILRDETPERFLEMNLSALEIGKKLYSSQRGTGV